MKLAKGCIAPLLVLIAVGLAIIFNMLFLNEDIERKILACILASVVVGVGGCVYVLPTFIAGLRNSDHYLSILLLNLLGGWTGIGWLAALLWAIIERSREAKEAVVVQQIIYKDAPPPVPSTTMRES